MTMELTFENFYLGAWGVRALAEGACRRRSSHKHAPVRGIHKKRCDYESCHVMCEGILYPKYNTLQQTTTTHCSKLQHTATHCNTHVPLQWSQKQAPHTATNYNTLQQTAANYSTLQHTATLTYHYSGPRSTRHTLQQTATTHCSKLQHTATPTYHYSGPRSKRHANDQGQRISLQAPVVRMYVNIIGLFCRI